MNQDGIRKLYIEPTSNCNLDCVMCPRNSWIDEKTGEMGMNSYEALINQLKDIKGLETIFFGGVAEPMSHKEIYKMIKIAKSLGVGVELITNGSFLDEAAIDKLLVAGLDMLWISIDTAHSNSYNDKITNEYDAIIKTKADLLAFNVCKRKINPNAKFGINFVAMKSNMNELPRIIRLGQVMGAKEIKISNIIPYEKEMQKEMLYEKTLSMMGFQDDYRKHKQMIINMPIMDFDRLEKDIIPVILRSDHSIKLGENMVTRKSGYCKFIQDSSLFVRWDGEVCPCIALLHSTKTYLHDTERKIRFCTFGNVNREHINIIWDSLEYKNFRAKVKEFSFSPCILCGDCSYVESNEEDCFGNQFPTCGGCLWAEGFAQCP